MENNQDLFSVQEKTVLKIGYTNYIQQKTRLYTSARPAFPKVRGMYPPPPFSGELYNGSIKH
jgi:hypothetical protein